jgi:hypothetical protein
MMKEPALIAGAIRAIILALVAFGLEWTGDQVAALMLAVEAVLTLFVRQTVTPNAKLVVLFCVFLLGSACTSRQLAIALQAESQVHEGLRRSRTTITTICPPENLSQMCSTAKSAFNDVLDAAIAYNRGLREKDLSQGPPLIAAIDRFVERVKGFKELGTLVGDASFAKEGVKQ